MVPAAHGLLDGSGYARAVLADGGVLSSGRVTFRYLNPVELAAIAATLAAAAPVARFATLRHHAPAVEHVRAVQSGSVNDYAAYQAAGLVLTLVTVLLGTTVS